jgi:phospholipase C
MNSVVTFYSYKGGVGRSMALANIAVLLARRGLKVLVVDFDLEAPGIERYFSYFEIKQGGRGLLRMCMEAQETGTADYTKFTSTFDCQGTHPVTLLSSGREVDETYTRNLEGFDWELFFKARGGAFVEELRERWRKDFNITLIDSRTGLSDTGGICTIQLPDIVVGMFTANLQSLYGVRDVMRLAQKARQTLAYDRMPLSVLPLAARWGVQEFQETQIWVDRVTEATKEFFEDWLPKGISPRDVIEGSKIPQVAYFGFGERLAVVEQGTSDPQGMGFVYDKLASFIASDFAKVDALVGEQKVQMAASEVTTTGSENTRIAAPVSYFYDVFFSHDFSMSDWVLEFTDRLKQELTALRGEPPNTFIDVQEIRSGDKLVESLSEALLRSKILVAFITPRYLNSQYASKEFFTFLERARETGKAVLVPILLRGDDFPDFVKEINPIDLRRLPLQKTPARTSAAGQREIRHVAETLNRLIDEAPTFDPGWRVVEPLNFRGIKRLVVLMLANRSFDHLFGFLRSSNLKIAGLNGTEFNQKDPNVATDPRLAVRRSTSFVMPFDPAHEFYDVQVQLYGPLKGTAPDLPPHANLPTDPAPMTGFVANAVHAVDFSGDEGLVMDCFQPDQLPVLSTLAKEFAVFTHWYSSLPGPAWPNRFFIHAATSGGLTDSPTTDQIIAGFKFKSGTIYERLEQAGKQWRIYHDGLPQTAGITNLRSEFINPLTHKFQDIRDFFEDVKNGQLADYNFIEPRYDTGDYVDGNSMHSLSDIRKGEALVKNVYERLRNSPHWPDTMLIITFDEHGGFYDHKPPPSAVPPGDSGPYSNPYYTFRFDRLGVRVPAIVVSAYTAKGTVVGTEEAEPSATFDHASVLATVEKLFGLNPLTTRDAAANTLEIVLTEPDPRLSATEALLSLPTPAPDSAVTGAIDVANMFAASPKAPLSVNQQTMAALALACDLAVSPPAYHPALISNHQKLVEQQDAARYIKTVESKIVARRASPATP